MFFKIFKTGIKVNGRKQTALESDNVYNYNLYNIYKSTSCYNSCEDVVNRAAGLFIGLDVDLYIDLMGIWGFYFVRKVRIDLLS